MTKDRPKFKPGYSVCEGWSIWINTHRHNEHGIYADTDDCPVLYTDNYWEAYAYALKMSKKLCKPIMER